MGASLLLDRPKYRRESAVRISARGLSSVQYTG